MQLISLTVVVIAAALTLAAPTPGRQSGVEKRQFEVTPVPIFQEFGPENPPPPPPPPPPRARA